MSIADESELARLKWERDVLLGGIDGVLAEADAALKADGRRATISAYATQAGIRSVLKHVTRDDAS